MPSIRGLLLIIFFWLGTTSYVVYRDYWPRWFGGDPPSLRIDISDEATQSVPVRWTVYRQDQRIGYLQTKMKYRETDDTFLFTSTYKDVSISFGAITMACPQLESNVRMTREGDLREQNLTGRLEAQTKGLTIATATAEVKATVENGMLVGTVKIDSPIMKVNKPLEPIPVPQRRALNPLMPVNKLQGIRPGKRWTIHESDPLADAMAVMAEDLAKKSGFSIPRKKPVELTAVVKSRPEKLERKEGAVECWVIEYRGEEARARTWVSVTDGRVMMQEAMGSGEVLRLVREE